MFGKLLTTVTLGIALVIGLVALVDPRLVRAQGQILIVTKFSDSNDGLCDADCSLREAIITANADSQADTIQLDAGVYRLTLQGKDEEGATSGDLDITEPVTIVGHGPNLTIIEAAELDDRVFDFLWGADTVIISGVTIRGGKSDTSGGGIFSQNVDFTLNNVVVRDNIATIRGGGLNIEGGAVTIEDSKILDNEASDGIGFPVDLAGGGGIYLATGRLQLKGGQILSNTVGGGQESLGGGGLCVCPLPGWSAELIQTGVTTIAYNATKFGGGLGIMFGGEAVLNGSQIMSNTATGHGGGVNIVFGEMIMNGGRIAGNISQEDGAGLAVYSEGSLLPLPPAKVTLNGVEVLANVASRDGGGLYIKKSKLTLSGGRVINNQTGAKAGGVYLFDGEASLTDIWLLDNIADNGGGIYQRGSGSLSINHSCLMGNADTSVYSDGPLMEAEGNWWGVIDGPSESGPGHGDSVSGNVVYDNFLTSAILGCPTRWLVDVGLTQQQTVNAASGRITYTVPFSNSGVQTAPDLLIEHTLPPGLTDVQFAKSNNQMTLSQTAELTYQWHVPSLPVNAQEVITLTGRIVGGQPLTHLVTITAPTSVDSNPHNNWSQITVEPLPFAVAAIQPQPNYLLYSNGPIIATFTRPVDHSLITTRTFTIRGAQTGVYKGLYDSNGTLDSAIFKAAPEFKAGEEITVNLSRAIKAPDGVAAAPYAWQFRAAVSGGSGHFSNSGQGLGEFRSFDVTLGDLDNDGDLDAFVVNAGDLGPGSGQPNQVWLNGDAADNLGSFSLSQSLGDEVSTGLALGDLDDDGDLDAFVTNWKQKNQIWLNGQGVDPPGMFSLSADDGLLGEEASRAVALADLNGDGHLDAFVVNEGGVNRVWFNDGSGTARFVAGPSLPTTTQSWDVALGDVNGDGALDAFVVNKEQPNELWLNDGAGNFDLAQTMDSDNDRSRAVVLGDLDRDGHLDAVVGNGYRLGQDNEVWLNGAGGNQPGTFSLAQSMTANNTWNLALGDVDGDDDLDLLVGNLGANEVWLNDGTGFLQNSGQSPGSAASFAVDLGDVDLDGDLDAFVSAFVVNEANQVWLNMIGSLALTPTATIYLPLLAKETSSDIPPPSTDLYITSVDTNGIDYARVMDPITNQLLGWCGEADGQPIIGNNITQFCVTFTPGEENTAYKLGVKTIKCGYDEEIFYDAVSLPRIRSVSC